MVPILITILECGPRDGEVYEVENPGAWLARIEPSDPVEIYSGLEVPGPETELTFKQAHYDIHTVQHDGIRHKVAIQPQLKRWLVYNGLIK